MELINILEKLPKFGNEKATAAEDITVCWESEAMLEKEFLWGSCNCNEKLKVASDYSYLYNVYCILHRHAQIQ